MKIHLTWIRVTAAAATMATFGGEFVAAQSQYGPYAAAPQYSTAAPNNVAPYGVQPTQPPAYPTTVYPTTANRAAYAPTQQQNGYIPTAQAPQTRPQYQPPQYQPPQYQPPQYQQPVARPIYPAVAQRSTGTVRPGFMNSLMARNDAAQKSESLPTPDPAVGGAVPQNQAAAMNGASPYPTTDGTAGYFASDPGYNSGACGCEATGVEGYFDDGGSCSHWFGGVYGLYMTRTEPGYRPYTYGVDTSATGTPYYPSGADTENYSDCAYLIPHWRGGVEVRLGCTFGIGDGCDYGDCGCGNPCDTDTCGCEPCCQPCCQQMYGWEIAWWGLDDDFQQQFVDGPVVGDFRYYGAVNYAGLEYDDGGGTQPVNDYYNYQSPIAGLGAETVLSQRVRTNFKVQNFELNFLRLPLLTAGCGYDCCAPAFSLTGLCGVRYFRFDDDLGLDSEWATGGQTAFDGWGNGTNELFHDVQMENQLVGFQLGANMNYTVACRWNAFWDTNFGIYNNHISQYQRMYNPLSGTATFAQDGRGAVANSNKDDVAFLGEMRLGGGYLISPRWRGILAYRAIAVSGVALAPDQINSGYNNWTDVARIDADGSLIVHGIQAGIECNY